MMRVLKAIGGFFGGLPQWLYIAIAIAAAALWLDHNGAARARAEEEARRLERQELAGKLVAENNRQIHDGLAELAKQTNRSISAIQTEDRTIVQPIIQREIARDPNLAARECLTPELVRAVNIARGYPDGAPGGDAADQRGSAPGVPGSAAATQR